ncbi:hypothetical protein HDA40_002212 [Hamadaea flava]|uniref:Uncharacterized protein n=1 Tax=Hamadaea flava TaxID=1742688 RepID=A0ABV8LJV6_9ACTN|nr:hypothetical protein [Hamadaea flava]MCP2323705.1 hypothetical protein [Hamadaea flava]
MTTAQALLLLPIGQFCGVSGPPGDPATRYPIRIADRMIEVDADLFTLWARAHGVSGDESWTGAELDALLSEGLAARIEPDDEIGFAHRHRLEPLLMGLGVDGDQFVLGLPGTPVVSVSGPMFTAWAAAAAEPDLWSVCLRLAAETAAEPAALLPGLLDGLGPLLAAGAAYLDKASR